MHSEYAITGNGVQVAILDTGIDPLHQDLNVVGGVSFVGGNWYDVNGHGTHVAGTVAALDNQVDVIGVSPEAALWAVKVLNDGGSGTFSGVAQGIEWCITHGVDIINMSLGGPGGSLALEQACQNAWNAGIVIVASAGNSGNSGGTGDNVGYPARYNTVIAVGAIDQYDQRAWFSSTGPYLEIMAPGVDIPSTRVGGGVIPGTGTSMAAPHVSGVAALLLHADPNLTNQEIRTIIRDTVELIGNGNLHHYGHGLVDAYEAVTDALHEPLPPMEIAVWTDDFLYAVYETVYIYASVVETGSSQPVGDMAVVFEIRTPDRTTLLDLATTDAQGVASITFYLDWGIYGTGVYEVFGTTYHPNASPVTDSCDFYVE